MQHHWIQRTARLSYMRNVFCQARTYRSMQSSWKAQVHALCLHQWHCCCAVLSWVACELVLQITSSSGTAEHSGLPWLMWSPSTFYVPLMKQPAVHLFAVTLRCLLVAVHNQTRIVLLALPALIPCLLPNAHRIASDVRPPVPRCAVRAAAVTAGHLQPGRPGQLQQLHQPPHRGRLGDLSPPPHPHPLLPRVLSCLDQSAPCLDQSLLHASPQLSCLCPQSYFSHFYVLSSTFRVFIWLRRSGSCQQAARSKPGAPRTQSGLCQLARQLTRQLARRLGSRQI